MLFELLDALGVTYVKWDGDDGIQMFDVDSTFSTFHDCTRVKKGDVLTLDGQDGDFGLPIARFSVMGKGAQIQMIEMEVEKWSLTVTHDTLETIKNYVDMKKL